MFKKILAAIIVLPSLGAIIYFAITTEVLQFESVCDKHHRRYTALCENVGKSAYSLPSVVNLNEKNYGVIKGLAWRKKGSIISAPGQKSKRYSESNSYYYIVANASGGSQQFLRSVGETDAR